MLVTFCVPVGFGLVLGGAVGMIGEQP